jgi:predicted  nucleic acid-binding Zn-ribbon protein
MKFADTRFTALGTSGAGKTCYIMGMYHEMSHGVRGWSITTDNRNADRIVKILEFMDEKKGKDKFPPADMGATFRDYAFNLIYQFKKVMCFHWIDYSGGTLEDTSLNQEAFKSVNDSIIDSSALYIFIDGELFCGDNREEKRKQIQQKCANYINRYIDKFVRGVKGKINEMPPIVFVITKYDLCNKDTSEDEVFSILQEDKTFGSIIKNPESLVYIVGVSLGDKISYDNYSGDIDPVSIQLPFFIGIYHDFQRQYLNEVKRLSENRKQQEKQIEKHCSEISELKRKKEEAIKSMEDFSDRISPLEGEIKKLNSNLETVEYHQKLFEKNSQEVNGDLRRIKETKEQLEKKFLKRIFKKKEIKELDTKCYNARKKIAYIESELLKQKSEREQLKSKIKDSKKKIEETKSEIENIKKNIAKWDKQIKEDQDKIQSFQKKLKNIDSDLNEIEKMMECLSDELRVQSKDFIMVKGGQVIPFSPQ